MAKSAGKKLVARNRKARHEYEFLETFEAGLVLTGTEIKSIRLAGRVNIQQGYVQARNGELYLVNANISEFTHGNRENHEPTRPRKLLLHRREISRIIGEISMKGVTCIPVQLYLKNGRAKLEIATVRGKKQHDKRHDLAKRDAQRQIERAFKEERY